MLVFPPLRNPKALSLPARNTAAETKKGSTSAVADEEETKRPTRKWSDHRQVIYSVERRKTNLKICLSEEIVNGKGGTSAIVAALE